MPSGFPTRNRICTRREAESSRQSAPEEAAGPGTANALKAFASRSQLRNTPAMIALDDLRQLPLHEKLFVMEALWDEISRAPSALPVPLWQQNLLDDREALIQSGQARFEDWDVARQDILAAVK